MQTRRSEKAADLFYLKPRVNCRVTLPVLEPVLVRLTCHVHVVSGVVVVLTACCSEAEAKSSVSPPSKQVFPVFRREKSKCLFGQFCQLTCGRRQMIQQINDITLMEAAIFKISRKGYARWEMSRQRRGQ